MLVNYALVGQGAACGAVFNFSVFLVVRYQKEKGKIGSGAVARCAEARRSLLEVGLIHSRKLIRNTLAPRQQNARISPIPFFARGRITTQFALSG